MAARSVPVFIAVGALLGTALLGLAACGSVPAAQAGYPASAQSLCADGRGADRVVVSRAPPRHLTLSGATQVRAMVAALCALPARPAGQNCPFGESVRLVFWLGGQSFPLVTVQESGCRDVSGLGVTRSWSGSASLGRMLDEAVGGMGRLTPGTHPSSVPFGP